MTPKIPTSYVPRDYQIPVWQAMVTAPPEKRKKRAALVWPRRAGKDLTCLNIIAYHALVIRPGNYYYFAPSYAQGEKIIWDGKNKDGSPFLSVFPGYPETQSENPNSVIASIDNRKMKIKLTNGSMFQVVGASDQDAVVGTNPVGCVFTEYSVQSPKFWAYMAPILLENDGIALFPYTVRGFNHGWQLYQNTKDDPTWHTEFHTAATTLHYGKRIITDEQIAQVIKEGSMSYETAQQEFFNDPYASNVGAYYGNEMRKLKEDGRIGNVPWMPEYPVYTVWDIGVKDATAIWFIQVDFNGNVNVIDCYSGAGNGIHHYINVIKSKPYTYGTHFAPHDIKAREFTTGKTRLELALAAGIAFQLVPNLSFEDGVEAVRVLLPRCQFNEEKCFDGLDALRQYSKKETDLVTPDGRPIFSSQPKHDWASHYADGFRYVAIVIDYVIGYNNSIDSNGNIINLPEYGKSDWDLFNF